MLDAAKRASAGRITAVLPYFAYGRSDKKDQPRVPITARLLASMIEVAGADRVLTLDLHAGQIQGFFSLPVDELTAVPTLASHFTNGDDVVVTAATLEAPDGQRTPLTSSVRTSPSSRRGVSETSRRSWPIRSLEKCAERRRSSLTTRSPPEARWWPRPKY